MAAVTDDFSQQCVGVGMAISVALLTTTVMGGEGGSSGASGHADSSPLRF